MMNQRENPLLNKTQEKDGAENKIKKQAELKEEINILVSDQRDPNEKEKFNLDKFIGDLNKVVASRKNHQNTNIDGWGHYKMEEDFALINNLVKAKAVYIEATTMGYSKEGTTILIVTCLEDNLFDKVMLTFESNERYRGHGTYNPMSKDEFKEWFKGWQKVPQTKRY